MDAFQDRFNRFTTGLNDKYEPYVKQHLAKVYMMLGGTSAVTAIGSMLQMKHIVDLGFLAALGSLFLVLGLLFYRDNGKNYYTRVAMLYAFGFCSGQSMGPLLSYVVRVDPSIIVTALVGTFITFASLSAAALLAGRGQFLFLGGILISVVNTMALLSLMNIFFKSVIVQMGQLYIGVIVMAGFILFDTQSIVEKVRLGNRDVVQHALDLFFDVLNMFRRLVIILTQKEERRRENERKRR
ncbi:bax inhibitor 1 [Stomoxys calcitrans]|uniref:Bax inhibitor 1 n=1 Tax=Stomoxys calcitrans TaxID=35570 RepID=A0A1I8PJ87_STOCA|nr:bax inhibitor 1 [Stomoxys calcitrans]